MDVYVKTAAGREEIDARTRKLAPGLRSVLLVVDGRRSGAELASMAQRLHAPADSLQQLSALGLIEPGGGAGVVAETTTEDTMSEPARRYRMLSELLSDAVRQHLGLRGFLMQLKIERCSNAADVEQLVPEMQAAIAKARGDAVAQSWAQVVRAAIAG